MDVTIFTRPGCASCQRAKEFLRGHDVAFTERDIDSDAAAMQELVNRGCRMLPVILVDGQIAEGFNPQELGKLVQL